ncbi:MAG: hypothetical protein AAF740_10765, partial [Bacteroidota bacterium]
MKLKIYISLLFSLLAFTSFAQTAKKVEGRVLLSNQKDPATYRFMVEAIPPGAISESTEADDLGNFTLTFPEPVQVGDMLTIRIQESISGIQTQQQVRLIEKSGRIILETVLPESAEEKLFKAEFETEVNRFWNLLEQVGRKGDDELAYADRKAKFGEIYALFEDGKQAVIQVSSLSTGTTKDYNLETYLNRLTKLDYETVSISWEIKEVK